MSGKTLCAHKSEAFWENESPFHLSVIYEQQQISENFLKPDQMSFCMSCSRTDSRRNRPEGSVANLKHLC